MKKLWIGLLLCGSDAANAQFMPPTDTDLHAAYCLETMKFEVNMLQEMISQTTANGAPTDTIASYKGSLGAAQASVQKFQFYLIARLGYLDPTGLLGAAATARSDLQRMLTSPPDLPTLQVKFQLCRDTSSWFPF